MSILTNVLYSNLKMSLTVAEEWAGEKVTQACYELTIGWLLAAISILAFMVLGFRVDEHKMANLESDNDDYHGRNKDLAGNVVELDKENSEMRRKIAKLERQLKSVLANKQQADIEYGQAISSLVWMVQELRAKLQAAQSLSQRPYQFKPLAEHFCPYRSDCVRLQREKEEMYYRARPTSFPSTPPLLPSAPKPPPKEALDSTVSIGPSTNTSGQASSQTVSQAHPQDLPQTVPPPVSIPQTMPPPVLIPHVIASGPATDVTDGEMDWQSDVTHTVQPSMTTEGLMDVEPLPSNTTSHYPLNVVHQANSAYVAQANNIQAQAMNAKLPEDNPLEEADDVGAALEAWFGKESKNHQTLLRWKQRKGVDSQSDYQEMVRTVKFAKEYMEDLEAEGKSNDAKKNEEKQLWSRTDFRTFIKELYEFFHPRRTSRRPDISILSQKEELRGWSLSFVKRFKAIGILLR